MKLPARLLAQLESLDLYGLKITDKCLPHLKRLTRLMELNLVDTQITDGGAGRLKRYMPNTKIAH